MKSNWDLKHVNIVNFFISLIGIGIFVCFIAGHWDQYPSLRTLLSFNEDSVDEGVAVDD